MLAVTARLLSIFRIPSVRPAVSGDLSRHFIKEEGILETEYSDMLCRTQIRVGIDDFRYFQNDPIGNPHIICKGSHTAELEAFFSLPEERDGG